MSQAQSWRGMPVHVLCGIDDGVRYLAGGGASGPPIDERDRLRQDCAHPLMPAAGLKIRYNMSQSPMQIIQAKILKQGAVVSRGLRRLGLSYVFQLWHSAFGPKGV